MIEINLIPDVKQEFIRAQRLRTMVVSFSILACLIAAGAVVVLSLYVFGAQGLRSTLLDNSIDSEAKKLASVEDLPNALTVQKQLETLPMQNDDKHVTSRLFDVLSTVVPTGKNAVQVRSASVDTENSTITLEGEAKSGYVALDAFKKTIQATDFSYREDGDNTLQSVPLATQVADGERSYGETSGQKVLRFTLSFTYEDALFARTSIDGTVIAPDRQNATDSAVSVPESLFRDTKENE